MRQVIEEYEVAVIGSGPAGLAAAINLKVRNKRFVLLGDPLLSHQVEVSPTIDNLLGFHNVKGKQLNSIWREHLGAMSIEVTDERVHQVYAKAMDDQHIVSCKNVDYKVKCVVVAAGLIRNYPIEGETQLLGKGVSYCATCDGAFYRDKHIIVIGSTKDAPHEVEYLCEIASEVTFLALGKAQKTPVEASNCRYIKGRGSQLLAKDGHFYALKMLDGQIIEADGLFIIKDAVGPAYLVPGVQSSDEAIFVDQDMRTNIEGIFAAGDCTGKPWQLMRSMGQGQVAALNCVRYLDEADYWQK